MSANAKNWKCFPSTQRVITQRPGFGWEGRIQMLKGLAVHARCRLTTIPYEFADETSDDWSEQGANARSHRHRQRAPERNPHGTGDHPCSARARRQRPKEREKQ